MRPALTLVLHPHSDLYHLSMVISGLTMLRDSKVIDLQFDVKQPTGPAYEIVYRLDARVDPSAPPVRCTIDLADRSDFWNLAELERSQLYLKRSYWTTRPAPQIGNCTILPFGMNYACRPRRFTHGVIRQMVWAIACEVAMTRSQKRYLQRRIQMLRAYLESPLPEAFAIPPEFPHEARIVYQTRLWSPQEIANSRQVNEERISLVRALKNAFKQRFMGGVIRNRTARELCPDLISHYPSGHRQYASWSRIAQIGVYTGGLHNSLAFKMPEYFASAKAVVASGVPADIVLPTPLHDGVQYLSFKEPDDCLGICDRLLSRSSDAKALGQEGHAYYQKECTPEVTARRLVQVISSYAAEGALRPHSLAATY